MKFMVLLLAVGYVVRTESSLHELPVHPGVGGLYRGPNLETIIKGPDGSVITAEAEGGAIHNQGTLEPIVVAEIDAEPAVSVTPGAGLGSVTPRTEILALSDSAADVSAVASPALANPVVLSTVTPIPLSHTIEIVQPDPHVIETEIVDRPVVESQQSSDLVGPSGSISTRGSSSIISGPASTTISEPARVLVAAVPVAASVTTPFLSAPVPETIPDSLATASIALQPTISTVTVGPPIHSVNRISTLAPPATWESKRISSSTILPPVTWDLGRNDQISPQLTISTPATILNQQDFTGTQQNFATINHLAASVEPASSYGVINNIANSAQISSTTRPELSVSSLEFPSVTPSQELLPPSVAPINLDIHKANHDGLNQAIVNNRQLNINPSLISSANTIPNERFSTIRPELSVYPSQFPLTVPSQELLPPPQNNLDIYSTNYNGLNQAVGNRQLNINPSLTPSVNIIPQEISSTVRPELLESFQHSVLTIPSRALLPTSQVNLDISSANYNDFIQGDDNRQLNTNPSLIPSANIIPHEISSTIRPQLLVSSSQSPLTVPSQELYATSQINLDISSANYNNLNQGVGNKLLNINPSLIPSANIIPHETSSTIRPELLVAPSQFPLTIPNQGHLPSSGVNLELSTANHNDLNQAVVGNRQLNINPSLLPASNIIPAEIGPLPARAIDLENIITVSSTPRTPGLYSHTESPNIQRPIEEDSVIVGNNIRNTDERFIYSDGRYDQLDENRQISIQNSVINPAKSVDFKGFSTQPESLGINVPLLRNTYPIRSEISQNGLIGAQLSKYGIDPSRINLSNVPLSSVTHLKANDLPLSRSIDDASAILWNRYGRDLKVKKN